MLLTYKYSNCMGVQGGRGGGGGWDAGAGTRELGRGSPSDLQFSNLQFKTMFVTFT